MDRSGSDSSGDEVFSDCVGPVETPARALPPTLLLTPTMESLFKTPPTILKTVQGSFTGERRFSYWRRLYANQVSVVVP